MTRRELMLLLGVAVNEDLATAERVLNAHDASV